MKRLATLALTITAIVLALLAAPPSAQAADGGINDPSCELTPEHPRPVVLLHGLGANRDLNWAVIGPQLKSAGYCTYSVTYGQTAVSGSSGGFASMRDSAAEISAFIDDVRAQTGADEVDVVGHSEGTTVAAYYLKFLDGAAKVDTFVGFGSNFKGSSVWGIQHLADLLGVRPLVDGVCPACSEFAPDSQFVADLNDGGVTVPGVNYVSIVSRYDEVVTPYTSGVLAPAANVENILLQDACALDFTGHLGQAWDPNVFRLIDARLDRTKPQRIRCTPMPFLG